MPSTGELARSGALKRAVILLRLKWTDQRVFERISEVFLGGTRQQYLDIIALAKKGIVFADSIDWEDPTFVIDMSQAPQLPP